MNQENSLRNTFYHGGGSLSLPKCMFCNHFIDSDDENALLACKAFPNGIPAEALWEEDEEKECSHGIRFEE